jgi:hypothetical protein
MRYILTAAAVAAIAATGFSVTSSANAEPTYVQGGPVQQGGMCSISTTGSDGFFGYMAPCPRQAAPARRAKKMKG